MYFIEVVALLAVIIVGYYIYKTTFGYKRWLVNNSYEILEHYESYVLPMTARAIMYGDDETTVVNDDWFQTLCYVHDLDKRIVNKDKGSYYYMIDCYGDRYFVAVNISSDVNKRRFYSKLSNQAT